MTGLVVLTSLVTMGAVGLWGVYAGMMIGPVTLMLFARIAR